MALSGVLSHLTEALAGDGGGDDTRKRISDALKRFDQKSCEAASSKGDKKGATTREVDLKALLAERKVFFRQSVQCCRRLFGRTALQNGHHQQTTG